MASLQRRRGEAIRIYGPVRVIDARGNETFQAARSQMVTTTAAVIPDRSSRAEAPGQVQIDVVQFIVHAEIPELTLWSRIEWGGGWYDMASPPALHVGNRATRHTTIIARRRAPEDGGGLYE